VRKRRCSHWKTGWIRCREITVLTGQCLHRKYATSHFERQKKCQLRALGFNNFLEFPMELDAFSSPSPSLGDLPDHLIVTIAEKLLLEARGNGQGQGNPGTIAMLSLVSTLSLSVSIRSPSVGL
jgi:hypothetical protein